MPLRFTNEQMIAWVENDEAFAEWYVDDFMRKNLPDFHYSVSAQGKLEMTLNVAPMHVSWALLAVNRRHILLRSCGQ